MQRIKTRDLAVMALVLALGLFSKRIVSPVTNLLTEFFRLPGGSAAAGFSLAFLLIGGEMVSVPFAGALMGLAQAGLALALGMSGYQGALALITYTLPGLVLDLASHLPLEGMAGRALACASACLTSAALSNMLVFHLRGLSLILWLLLAALSGVVGGWLAHLVLKRLDKQNDRRNRSHEEKSNLDRRSRGARRRRPGRRPDRAPAPDGPPG